MRQCLVALCLSVSFLSASAAADTVGYDVKSVTYKNLVAKLYLPKQSGKVPVVIAFGGSDGGMNFAEANGAMIAPHGVAVLGLAYFKETGLPATLDHIPMEYFVDAINFLETVPEVDAKRIGVVSGSRGSEAAFILAAMDQRIKSLALTTPSKLPWYGKTTARSAWTYKGRDIPALSLELDEQAPVLERFNAALKNQPKVRRALFAFERIKGAIFMVSAENDTFWPSYSMSKDIEAYLQAQHFRYPVVHHSYPTGHGFSKESAPKIKQSIIDHFVKTL